MKKKTARRLFIFIIAFCIIIPLGLAIWSGFPVENYDRTPIYVVTGIICLFLLMFAVPVSIVYMVENDCWYE